MNESDIIIIDTIDADQIEPGDQIVLDGEYITVDEVHDDETEDDGIFVKGYSWDEGDTFSGTLPYTYRVDVWVL